MKTLGGMISFLDTSSISYNPRVTHHDECNMCTGHPRRKIFPWRISVKSETIVETDNEWMEMYHGTRNESMESILRNGIDPMKCEDSSFGHGIYFTPCPNLAKTFSNNGLALCCKINTRSIRWFDTYAHYATQNITREQEQDPNYQYTVHALIDRTEFIVFQPQNVVFTGIVRTRQYESPVKK